MVYTLRFSEALFIDLYIHDYHLPCNLNLLRTLYIYIYIYIFMFYKCCILCVSELIIDMSRFVNTIMIIIIRKGTVCNSYKFDFDYIYTWKD